MSPHLATIVGAALLGAGLLLPGWLLGRALGAKGGAAGTLLGSAAILVNLILVLDALHIQLIARNVSLGLAVICALLLGACRFRLSPRASVNTGPAGAGRPPMIDRYWLLLLVPAVIAATGIAYRVAVDPVSGFDTYFRWDFLARQMVREANLSFYPPIAADDFRHYGWCDGIAPLVSSLYFWAYLSFGHTRETALVPVVMLQVPVLFWTLYQLAARRGGHLVGALACACFATSSAALWSIAMGQETALLTLALVSMFLFVEKHGEEPDQRWLVWAGIAAGVGALAREYGIAFVGCGMLVLAWRRTSLRGWVEFIGAAGVVAAPWYIRNWVRTGNPLWSHSLFGVFPTNPTHIDYMRAIAELNHLGAAPQLLVQLALALAGVPLLLGVSAALFRPREHKSWLAAMLVVTALWLWSVGQTAGGYSYSIRVLTPAVALGALLAAHWLRNWMIRPHGWLLAAFFAVLATDATLRSFYLPVEPYAAWWGRESGSWRLYEKFRTGMRKSPNWAVLAAASGGRDILVIDPSSLRAFVDAGAHPVSLFSPSLRFLFESDADYALCVQRLQASSARFMFLPRRDAYVTRQFSRYPFFRTLLAKPPTADTADHAIYDLDAMSPTRSPTPLRPGGASSSP